jgi:hypothetical protein
MRRVDLVVTVGRDCERAHRLDAAAQQAEDVEGRLVGPMDVLQHEHAGRRTQLVEQRAENVVRLRSGLDQAGELAPRRAPDIGERPERARREQGVAGTREETGPAGHFGSEGLNQRRLSASGLGSEENEPPTALLGRGLHVRECLEEVLALEQTASRFYRHDPMVAPGQASFKATPS